MGKLATRRPGKTGLPSLEAIAERINETHQAAEAAAKTAIQHALECGQLLVEAKSRMDHGEWLPWLREHCSVGERQARNYMRLAANWREVEAKTAPGADLTIKDAVRLLSDQRGETVDGEKRNGDFPKIPSFQEGFDAAAARVSTEMAIGGFLTRAAELRLPQCEKLIDENVLHKFGVWMDPANGYLTDQQLLEFLGSLSDMPTDEFIRNQYGSNVINVLRLLMCLAGHYAMWPDYESDWPPEVDYNLSAFGICRGMAWFVNDKTPAPLTPEERRYVIEDDPIVSYRRWISEEAAKVSPVA